jgi:hypothetical protein
MAPSQRAPGQCLPGNGGVCVGGPSGPGCCPGAGCCPANGCCDECVPCDRDDACKVAKLIYESQTACSPKDREGAIDDLDGYDIVCYPEIMAAFLYALNDCDPKVRAQAADEIGDALEDNDSLCDKCVLDALCCALADCDKDVVKQAEEALDACGYEIIDACDLPCDVACAPYGANGCVPCGPNGCVPYGPNGCAPYGPGGCAPAQPGPMKGAPMKGNGTVPAPAPPQEPKAYYPQQLPRKPLTKKFSLSRLFTMLD